ncbi:hypothetical protein M2323_004679, partial [Rhodoblastus acidophilus]|uniref:hypothetical protein n=1 Tax=Rhodoblastus acidophilus TaxID=1074 RepID=UPI002224A380
PNTPAPSDERTRQKSTYRSRETVQTTGTSSVECVGWIERNIQYAPKLLKKLAEEFPAHPSTGVLDAAAHRLGEAQCMEASQGAPNERVLACGMPVVNRNVLRAYLGEIMSGQDVPVIVVEGARGLGRSHSWNLIRYVANALPGTKPVLIDLIGPITSGQNLLQLFKYLVSLLALPPGDTPTLLATSSITQSERCLGELAGRIQTASASWPKKPWLVFDHLDRDIVAPEVKYFVMGLAALRLQGVIDGFVIFLLGPDPTAQLNDPAALARREPLTDLLDPEIFETMKRLNALGKTKLTDAELAQTQHSLSTMRAGRPAREFLSCVCSELVAMRQRVGAC